METYKNLNQGDQTPYPVRPSLAALPSIGTGMTPSSVVTSRIDEAHPGPCGKPTYIECRLQLHAHLHIEGTCDQGTLSGHISYHDGCQPSETAEDTILPHWTIHGIFFHRYAPDDSVPKFSRTLTMEGRGSYGMEPGKTYPANVINSFDALQPDGVDFSSRGAALNYLRTGAVYCQGELLTNIQAEVIGEAA